MIVVDVSVCSLSEACVHSSISIQENKLSFLVIIMSGREVLLPSRHMDEKGHRFL